MSIYKPLVSRLKSEGRLENDCDNFTIVDKSIVTSAAVIYDNKNSGKKSFVCSNFVYIENDPVIIEDINLFLKEKEDLISNELKLDLDKDVFIAFFNLSGNTFLIYDYESDSFSIKENIFVFNLLD